MLSAEENKWWDSEHQIVNDCSMQKFPGGYEELNLVTDSASGH